MNFALIGYGKMGKTIEALGNQQGHAFPLIIDEHNQEQLHPGSVNGIEVAIEFSVPASAPANIRKCIDLGLPVVSGTTGWNEKIPEIEAHCKERNGTFFYASNFSIGVNILFALNRKLAELMEQFPEYKAGISEVHHVHKADKPSGTAISLAQQILEANKKLRNWYLKPGEGSEAEVRGQLPIVAQRKGEVKGRHSISWESHLDSITLSHDAKSRDAFAAGVLLAAEFIKERKGVFGMQDLLNL